MYLHAHTVHAVFLFFFVGDYKNLLLKHFISKIKNNIYRYYIEGYTSLLLFAVIIATYEQIF